MQKRVTLLNVSSGPHVRSKLSTSSVMYNVILALVPSAIVGVYFHGLEAFLTILVTILSTVASEAVFDIIVKKPVTIKDGSAVLTGLLLALCLPSCCPLYIPSLGGVFAIVIVKCLFGGLG
ncbi:MAG: RnfABCDGE type electron transport complex subunit D, partial [Blautia sp.]|nr:RnfABCDGE type electron transport complex subunit D [Blautia sp.]